MSRVQPADVVYFGKLPSRGDFVRNGDASGLTSGGDRDHGLRSGQRVRTRERTELALRIRHRRCECELIAIDRDTRERIVETIAVEYVEASADERGVDLWTHIAGTEIDHRDRVTEARCCDGRAARRYGEEGSC